MKIKVEALPKELKNEVVWIGGICNYYPGLDDCLLATFMHHELETYGDNVKIIDDLTGRVLDIKSTDFFTIEIM